MKRSPLDFGPIHFVGIGGIGMSGIAQVMVNLGYRVQGSDLADNANAKRLRGLGAEIAIGHAADNLGEAKVLVTSTAIPEHNPEVAEARARRLPIVRRAEMLAELMRLKYSVGVGGTHGKTTTTSLVAACLDAGGLDPTVINGGVIHAYGSNARMGEGEWMVVEADESDGTFLKLRPTVAVVTNIDREHMDHYPDFDALKRAFEEFVENVPFYGFGVLCIDHPEVQALVGRIRDRRVVTYGFSPQADVRAENWRFEDGASRFDVVFVNGGEAGLGEVWAEMRLPMPGRHNAENALAAIATARALGVGEAAARAALEGFGGVNRRFTRVGSWNGVEIIDDYGHHPVEIAAVLAAARQSTTGRVIAIAQPHRYTRLRDLFEEFCAAFNDADQVFIADVYPAGEAPIEGVDRDALVRGLSDHGHRAAAALSGPEDLPDLIHATAEAGDYVVFLGAGDITAWANALPAALAERAAQ